MVTTSGATSAYRAVVGPTASGPLQLRVVQRSAVRGLYPGAGRPLWGTFDNPGRGAATHVTLEATVVPFRVGGRDGSAACTQQDLTITGSSTVSARIAPGAASGHWSGLVLHLSPTAPPSCAGIRIPISYATG
jgi:hypothetical protein